jgi:putative NIF3 family GTP cyclohydrolase 1 type 2
MAIVLIITRGRKVLNHQKKRNNLDIFYIKEITHYQLLKIAFCEADLASGMTKWIGVINHMITA